MAGCHEKLCIRQLSPPLSRFEKKTKGVVTERGVSMVYAGTLTWKKKACDFSSNRRAVGGQDLLLVSPNRHTQCSIFSCDYCHENKDNKGKISEEWKLCDRRLLSKHNIYTTKKNLLKKGTSFPAPVLQHANCKLLLKMYDFFPLSFTRFCLHIIKPWCDIVPC